MPKKVRFEDWKQGKEYVMWFKLKEICDSLGVNGAVFISKEDLGGCYWEPLLELIYKYGNIVKKTGKLKEIKMEWLRPINYLGAQSDIEVTFDGEKYRVPKLATGSASEVRFAFQHLLDSIMRVDQLDDNNFQKEYKTFQSDVTRFLKLLYSFVYSKDENGISGYRYLVENIKDILFPLRMLRKSAYRLFSVEKNEEKYQDLLTFQDHKDLKEYVEGVQKFFESEAYKQQRDCDVNELDKYMGMAMNEEYYKYKFSKKKHEDEPKQEEKDDKGNPKEVKERKKERQKTLSAEELEKIQNEAERRKLTLINIKELKESLPNSFIKDAMQKDLETGYDLMFKFLSRKIVKDFPFTIESHKMFVNLNKTPHGREIPQIEFYLGQLYELLEEIKVMCYEMKLNGLSRVLIPIQANKEFVGLLKKIYDIHNIIDRILGDKLLYEQYLFIYDRIKFIHESTMKDELEVCKTKKLVEQYIPRYIFYMSMVHSANIYLKFQEDSRKDGGHFTLDQYYQPLKHEIDGPNNIALNAYEMNEQIQKGVSANYKENERIFWNEVDKYGRFWLMEGYFPPEDRDKWIEAIDCLANINRLVQEDIRDMILTGNDEKYKNNEAGVYSKQNYSKAGNTDTSLISENSFNQGKEDRKKSGRGKKRTTSKKTVNALKNQVKQEKPTVERKDSMDSTDEILLTLPKNANGLRPPFVWNFPVERIEEIRDELKREKEKSEEINRIKNMRGGIKKPTKPQMDFAFKDEPKKIEIRKVNPFPYYHDGRIEKFVDLFNELFANAMKYANSKGNIWEYVYCKVLQVFNVEYTFVHPKEEPEVKVNKEPVQEKNDKEAKKDAQAKEGKPKEETAKEGENEGGEAEGENKEGEQEGAEGGEGGEEGEGEKEGGEAQGEEGVPKEEIQANDEKENEVPNA